MSNTNIRWAVLVLGALGVVFVLVLHWMVFFWVPTESTMGIIQRIFYIHVPAWWAAFLGFGIVALCSVVYLWLGDDRLDRAALAAAEGGMVFCTVGLITGPLWGRSLGVPGGSGSPGSRSPYCCGSSIWVTSS